LGSDNYLLLRHVGVRFEGGSVMPSGLLFDPINPAPAYSDTSREAFDRILPTLWPREIETRSSYCATTSKQQGTQTPQGASWRHGPACLS
jgi:hypothetical protein